jgi:outer membrane protein OmpA-like peptidoglycan-associated protein
MKTYRALLLGSVALGLISHHAYSRDFLPAQANSIRLGDSAVTAPIQLAADDTAAAPEDTPAAAATETAAPPPAATAEAPAATAEAPASAGSAGVTSFYGDGQSPDADKPWAAPATPNPDYSAEVPAQAPAAAEAPPAETAPAAAAAEEPAPPATGGQGVTSYYGDGQTPDAGKPWSAPAAVNPDYNAQPAPTAATPAGGNAVETCRDALNAEVHTGKITFDMSSWDITSDSFTTLDKIAKLAKDCSGVTIEVGGHTDNTGKPASNQTISELRAKAVMKYLVREGVEASKLKAVGYGQDKPVGDNGTSEGRAQNRRIEFSVTAS